MLVDSHCHLDFPDFSEERAAVVARARAAGVGHMVTICTRVRRFDQVLSIAEAFDNVFCSVGTHPHNAGEEPDIMVEELVELARHPKVVAIGEAGLDYHYDHSPRDMQKKSFRTHIAAARETGLPLVVHTREADEVMGDILEEEYARGAFKMLMHCYTSGAELAARAAALGAWFSVSGIATFKAAEDVRAVVRDMPADRIIVETDCPYLAPIPHRGRRNEPAYLPAVLAKLAEIRGWSAQEAEQNTEEAFFALFDRIPRP